MTSVCWSGILCVMSFPKCIPNDFFPGNLLVVLSPKQFTLLSRKHRIAWYFPSGVNKKTKKQNKKNNIFMSDVATFQSVSD